MCFSFCNKLYISIQIFYILLDLKSIETGLVFDIFLRYIVLVWKFS